MERDDIHLRGSRLGKSNQVMKNGSPGEAWALSNSQPQWRKNLVLVLLLYLMCPLVGEFVLLGKRAEESELEGLLPAPHS